MHFSSFTCSSHRSRYHCKCVSVVELSSSMSTSAFSSLLLLLLLLLLLSVPVFEWQWHHHLQRQQHQQLVVVVVPSQQPLQHHRHILISLSQLHQMVPMGCNVKQAKKFMNQTKSTEPKQSYHKIRPTCCYWCCCCCWQLPLLLPLSCPIVTRHHTALLIYLNAQWTRLTWPL